MTFLPIIESELRASARRPTTQWTRFFAALATRTLWLLVALSTPRWVPVPQLSRNLFTREIAFGPLSKEVSATRTDRTAGLNLGQRPLNSAQP